MADNFLDIQNLTKTYDDGKRKTTVLENLSFSMSQGEFVVLLGPSGSGKSTLLHLIGLLDNPTSGHIKFEGRNATLLSEKQKAALRMNKIGFVFQFDSLLAEFTMLENVDMPALLAGKPDAACAFELLERFGLKQLAGKMPAELSGGEKQRTVIARALRNGPRLILADEPTGNLDAANTIKILEDFKRLSQSGVSVLMVTHNHEASRYASRVFNLTHGALAEITIAASQQNI